MGGDIRKCLLPLLVVFAWICQVQAQSADADLIKSLPGLTFSVSFNQYSGFLHTTSNNYLHYWLTEAQDDADNKPLILWLQGGPGCSSLDGMFSENGPFQVSPDGQTLTENVYSWNKLGNVLYLEAPAEVGFSYRDPSIVDNKSTDNKTRDDNAEALQLFVQRFPKYAGRKLIITGESYSGVYIPTLSVKITQLIDNKQLNLVFAGIAIGNGIISSSKQVNSYIDLAYYRGIIGKTDFEFVKSCCPTPGVLTQYCDYVGIYLDFDPNSNMYNPKPSVNATFDQCALNIALLGQNDMWMIGFHADVYNSIESCYEKSTFYSQNSKEIDDFNRIKSMRSQLASSSDSPVITDGLSRFVDQFLKINQQSTDPWGAYPCYAEDAIARYLNRKDVKTAINLTPIAMNRNWTSCTKLNYTSQYPELDAEFNYLTSWTGVLPILIYNGDADSVCNFIGDQWFVEGLANHTLAKNRTNWFYTMASSAIGGSQMSFVSTVSGATIDFVTVKGAGHMLPMDRSGPMFQVLANFISQSGDYNTVVNVSATPKPLLPQYAPPQPTLLTRKQADKVYDIPGLTFDINFDTYAGYLRGVPGNFLHYWLITSQNQPSSDPLFVWLTGGPGCSSLGALLTELGPFRPNYDNKTLSENVFAWNKIANILFLESPRGVGFSFQDTTINNDTVWDDQRSANDAYLAIKDFLTAYPEYIGRDFYLVGESYAGVYVPMLSALLVSKIQSGDLQGLNFVGLAIGNGELNSILNSNSLMSDLYYHGYIGKNEWDSLAQCCNTTYQELPFCRFDERYYIADDGNADPKNASDPCDVYVADKINNVWTEDLLLASDIYNAYQDCYLQTSYIIGSLKSARTRKRVFQHIHNLKSQYGLVSSYRYSNDNYNPISTDALGGFPCFGTDSAADYLNRPEVRRALHVPENNPYVNPNWQFCDDDINANYVRQINDTSPFFDQIINSGMKIKILIYNGDTDFACNFVGDQWFTEAIASRWGLSTVEPYSEWHYRNQIAGYAKKFQGGNVTLNLLTVKGAGHMVPMDRPGPALQMLSNFFGDKSWNTSVMIKTDNTPLKPQYSVREKLTNISITQPASTFKKARGIQLDLFKDDAKTRTKREAKADPPPPTTGNKAHDKITDLPGLTFALNPDQDQYSGYLTALKGVYLHYWLIESAFNKSTAPIILWLNGGPGCSSLGGLLNELGPFRPSPDGSKLYENPYAWTKAGNVLFLEAPRGVGFSYSSGADYPSDGPYNDTLTAANNVEALISFFNMYTEYQHRPFYITGESYGGVYIPTLSDALIKRLQKDNITYINFAGFAIGNGEMSEKMQISSAVNLLYFKGQYDMQTFKQLSACCPEVCDGSTYCDPCDLTKYITIDIYGNAHALQTGNATIDTCGQLVEMYGFDNVWGTLNDVYNTYQDCYNPPYSDTGLANNKKRSIKRRTKRAAGFEELFSSPGQTLANTYPFVDQAKLMNKDSTDSFRGVYCYQDDATLKYLNNPAVQKALHVDAAGITWQDCNDDMNEHYHQEHNDTRPVFDSILASNWPLRILIYNGDVDMACQFKGDEWFIERLAFDQQFTGGARTPWTYKFVDESGWNYDARIGGFGRQFTSTINVTLDQLTVKGGGHFVPLDRPGPCLQMIFNFVNNLPYNTSLDYSRIKPVPLIPMYTPAPLAVSPEIIRQATHVRDLPGLTFTPKSMTHSGYLTGQQAGNYLHFWFAESQNSQSDPVLFWLSGDVGCSSVAGMLSEMGPFRPNPDGDTLFENVYSWNKFAHIVFIELPAGVGFSFIDEQNAKPSLTDDTTTADATAAIAQWLQIFTQFAGNDIYIGGETLAGVLVPLTAQLIADGITANKSGLQNVNFKGIMIGNGHVSKKWDLQHMGDFMYFHDQVSKEYWDSLRKCCSSTTYCDISKYVLANGTLDTTTACGKLLDQVSDERIYKSALDVYNIYQDCYGFVNKSFGVKLEDEVEYHVRENSKHKRDNRLATKAAYVSQFTRMNFKSTDSNGGFQCYMIDGIQKYLNQALVRDALNIPDYVQQFEVCNSTINYLYTQQYNIDYKTDMTDVFTKLMNSAYLKSLSAASPFKIMLYNGDLSFKATVMETEYFTETLATSLNAVVNASRSQWLYQQPGKYGRQAIGGYRKQFDFGAQNVKLDLVTVKGAGTFVAADRPGPALQLFNYFISSGANSDVNAAVQFSLARQPLKSQYQAPTPAPAISPPPDLPTKTTTVVTPPVTVPAGTTTPAAAGTTTTTAAPASNTTTVPGASSTTPGPVAATTTSGTPGTGTTPPTTGTSSPPTPTTSKTTTTTSSADSTKMSALSLFASIICAFLFIQRA